MCYVVHRYHQRSHGENVYPYSSTIMRAGVGCVEGGTGGAGGEGGVSSRGTSL
jgi:hypothetical protein